MGLGVGFAQIVCVIGAHHGQSRLLMDAQDALVYHRLVPDAVILKLQIEMVRSEDPGQLQGIGLGVFVLPVAQHPGDLPRQTRAQGNEALAVGAEQLQINPGLDVEALGPGHGYQIGKVAVALLILAQQHQMTALGVKLVELIEPGPARRRDIHLTADDGLDPRRQTRPIEVDGTVHDAVVGNGAGGLPHGLDDAGQILNPACAVQKAELGMNMQMDKGHSTSPVALQSVGGLSLSGSGSPPRSPRQ